MADSTRSADGAASRERALAACALLVVQVTAACYNVLTAEALKSGVDPLVFSFVRDALAYPLLQLAALAFERTAPAAVDVPRIAALGFFLFVNQFGYIMAMRFMSATLAAVLQQVALCTFLLSVALGLEAWSWRKAAGVLCALAGCVVVELAGGGGGGSGGGGGLALGTLCLVAAAFGMASYYILQRPLLRRYSPLSLTAWLYGVATLFTAAALPFSVGSLSPAAWRLAGGEQWAALAVAVLGNSCLKYYLQSFANRGETSVNVVAVFGALPPILTGVLEVCFLHAPLQARYFGALPILAGVALVVTAETTPRDPTSLWAWQRALLGAPAEDATMGAGAGALVEVDSSGGDAGDSSSLSPLLVQ